MQRRKAVPLSGLTTMRLGGPARVLVTAETSTEIVDAVLDAQHRDDSVLVIAGGSNLVISDDGFDGTAVQLASTGLDIRRDGDLVEVTVAAGENWDTFVRRCVSEGWTGVECLAGIPGAVGSTPIQNVGAYGQDVSATITRLTVLDRATGQVEPMPAAECRFGYRASRFKHSDDYVVLEVTFRLVAGPDSEPIAYAELARTLGVEVGDRAPLREVSEAVVGLRRGKGMVLDAEDHDTWSCGSFFTNPVLSQANFEVLRERAAERFGPDLRVPGFPDGSGGVKSSAAWLIQRSGFEPGYGSGPATISTKHTLALTNRGSATTADLIALATEVRDGVREQWGVTLHAEPVLVGVALP